jgi:hypothetical protein
VSYFADLSASYPESKKERDRPGVSIMLIEYFSLVFLAMSVASQSQKVAAL